MKECMTHSDLLEISQGSLDSFEQELAGIPQDLCAPFFDAAGKLEAELLTVYRVVVMCTKREEDLERVSRWWGTMVQICDNFAKRLSALKEAHPDCGANHYYDRVLELRTKCHRLQKMHS
jgi:hypothetical protein